VRSCIWREIIFLKIYLKKKKKTSLYDVHVIIGRNRKKNIVENGRGEGVRMSIATTIPGISMLL
jgi:hypothetical protein